MADDRGYPPLLLPPNATEAGVACTLPITAGLSR